MGTAKEKMSHCFLRAAMSIVRAVCQVTFAGGVRLQSLFGFSNLSVQNTGDYTFLRGLFRSVIDLTVTGGNTASWSTTESESTDDHFSIIFDMSLILSRVYRTMRKFTNTSQCQELLKESLSRLQCAD